MGKNTITYYDENKEFIINVSGGSAAIDTQLSMDSISTNNKVYKVLTRHMDMDDGHYIVICELVRKDTK